MDDYPIDPPEVDDSQALEYWMYCQYKEVADNHKKSLYDVEHVDGEPTRLIDPPF